MRFMWHDVVMDTNGRNEMTYTQAMVEAAHEGHQAVFAAHNNGVRDKNELARIWITAKNAAMKARGFTGGTK